MKSCPLSAFLAIVCTLPCAADARRVPAAPPGYRRPVAWSPNRYSRSLQQVADEFSSKQAVRARREIARINSVNGKGRWKPDLESLRRHVCPKWFEDAKFGVFIDWNLYSVASYATEKKDAAYYPDWYCDFMHYDPGESKDSHLEANGVRSYHEANWGKDFKRDDFIPLFSGRRFDAERLCRFLKDCGARYFVPFLKHHDGFCLWDSSWTRRTSVCRGPRRDFAAEMVAACRVHGLKFGFYFSTGEWEYPFLRDDGAVEVRTGGLRSGAPWPTDPMEFETRISGKVAVRDYAHEYIIPQAVEFIDRFDPDILWFDGEWDSPWQFLGSGEIAAYFYNQAEGRKEVAVNDRFGLRHELPKEHTRQEMFANLLRCHCGDFYTDESGDVADKLNPSRHHAWEECTGISKCYGCHWNESEANVLGEREFLEEFTGVVARGGNLLLLVNLNAEGTIPETEERRLRQIGTWLRKYGEAIYGTRTCAPYSTKTVDYTRSGDGKVIYAIVKCVSESVSPLRDGTTSVTLECQMSYGAKVTMLDSGIELKTCVQKGGVRVAMPIGWQHPGLPYVLKIHNQEIHNQGGRR